MRLFIILKHPFFNESSPKINLSLLTRTNTLSVLFHSNMNSSTVSFFYQHLTLRVMKLTRGNMYPTLNIKFHMITYLPMVSQYVISIMPSFHFFFQLRSRAIVPLKMDFLPFWKIEKWKIKISILIIWVKEIVNEPNALSYVCLKFWKIAYNN